MKKILLYILIATLLSQVLGLGVKTVEATAVCLDSAGKPTELTEAACKRNEAIGYKWNLDGGVCLDAQGKPTTLTYSQCKDGAFLKYTWQVKTSPTNNLGVCKDAGNQPVNFNKDTCEAQFSLGYKWDPNGVPPQCWPPKVLQDGECRAPTAIRGTCREEKQVYGTPEITFSYTIKSACTGAGTSWKQSTKAEFDAESGTVNNPAQPQPSKNTSYKLLAPLPCPPGSWSCDESGMLTTYDVGADQQLGRYLNVALQIFIGICAVSAVIVLVIAGIEYMSSDLISSKEEAKTRGLHAIGGLLLALGCWTILNTINPELLNTDMKNLTSVTLFIEGPEMELSGEAAKAICDRQENLGGQIATSCAENEIVSVSLMGKVVRVNKAIAADIQAIDADLKKSTDPRVKAYVISQLGSYNPRHAINSNTPSAHAFGLALDINSSKNPYSESTGTCTTDMPPGFVKIFTAHGFGWGGYWHSKKDTMHFSKLPAESAKYRDGSCAGLK